MVAAAACFCYDMKISTIRYYSTCWMQYKYMLSHIHSCSLGFTDGLLKMTLWSFLNNHLYV